MELRLAGVGDIEGIAMLHADSWRRHYRGAYNDEFLDGDVYDDRRSVWTERLSEPTADTVTLVADNGALAGFVHVVLDEDPTWGSLIDNLHVTYAVKRQGVGRELMARAAAESLARTSTRQLYLWVLDGNHDAQAFYEAVGGQYAGRKQMEPAGGGQIVGLRYVWPDGGKLAEVCRRSP